MQSKVSFKDRQLLFAFRVRNTATVAQDDGILKPSRILVKKFTYESDFFRFGELEWHK